MQVHYFKRCVGENLVILKKAFEGEFIIPEFARHCQMLEDIYYRCKINDKGKVGICQKIIDTMHLSSLPAIKNNFTIMHSYSVIFTEKPIKNFYHTC